MLEQIQFEMLKLKNGKLVHLVNICIILLTIFIIGAYIYLPNNKGYSMHEQAMVQTSYGNLESELLLEVINKEIEQLPNEQYRKMEILFDWSEDVHKLLEYGKYIDVIEENENLLMLSDYEERNVKELSNRYGKLKEVSLPVYFTAGVEWLVGSSFLDIMIIIIMAIWIFYLVLQEYDNGCFSYIRIMKTGSTKLLMSKWILLCISCILNTAIVYGIGLVTIYLLVGGPNLTAPVQCIIGMMACPYRITVGTFYALFILFKALVLIGYISILFLICMLLRSLFLAMGTFFSILIIEWLLTYFIDRHSIYKSLVEINLIQALDIKRLFANWTTLNILGYPIQLWICILTIFVLLVVGCLYGAVQAFSPPSPTEVRFLVGFRKKKEKEKTKRFYSDRWHERYKLWISLHCIILFLVFVIFQMAICQRIRSDTTNEEMYYQWYHKQLYGAKDSVKENVILTWEREIEEKKEKLEYYKVLYSEKEIQEVEYLAMKELYSVEMSNLSAFERVKNDYYRTIKLKEQGVNAVCIPQSGWELLVGTIGKERDSIMLIILEIFMIIGISNYVTHEYTSGMIQLIKVYPNGKKINRRKLGTAIEYSLLMTILAYWPRRIIVMYHYGISFEQYSCQSVFLLRMWPGWIPIWVVWGIKLFVECLVSIIICFFILKISHYAKNKYKALLCSCLIVFGTLVLLSI